MKVLEDIKEMLEDELKEVKKRGTHTPAEYEFIHTAVQTIGEIQDICERHNFGEEYSGGYNGNYSGRNYNRGGGYYSGSNMMPMNPHTDNSSRYYSGDSSKRRIIRELEEMIDRASTDYERETIRSCIDKLSR